MDKYALLTNDVETTSIWFNDLRDETGELVVQKGMPILLDLYRKYKVKSTFYFTAYIANLYPEVVRMILSDGHEVGSHGKSHIKDNGFDVMPFSKQKHHLEYAKKTLEDIAGCEVISFRAPALRVSPQTSQALLETGFKTDSSIASQRFDFFLSFGGMNKLRFLTAPRLPYRTKKDNIFKKGDSELLEIPLSATLIPFVGTTLRIFPSLTYFQQRILDVETGFTRKPVVFGIHPNEFIDESASPRAITRRSKNPLGYLLTDLVRAKIKVKNLGPAAEPLYERFIAFYANQNYRFITAREYEKGYAK